MSANPKAKSSQEIQYDIFRKMTGGEKLKLVSDFSMIGLELKLPEGTKIPCSYLTQWLCCNATKKNLFYKPKTALLRPSGNHEVIR